MTDGTIFPASREPGALGKIVLAVGPLRPPRHLVVTGYEIRVASTIQRRDDVLVHEKLLDPIGERRPLRRRLRRLRSRNGHRHRFLEERIVPALDHRAFEHLHFARRLREHDLAGELAAIFFEVGVGVNVDANDVGRDDAVRAGRPRAGHANERLDLRLDNVGAEAKQRPPFAERPLLLVDLSEAPRGQSFLDPFCRLPHGRRALQARPVNVGKPAHVIERL